MDENIKTKWIGAASKIIEQDLTDALCPICNESPLIIFDVYNDEKTILIEKYITCEKCDIKTAFLIKKPINKN